MPPLDLQRRTLLITRPLPEAEETARLVTAANGAPLLAPALTIQPPRDPGPFLEALHHPERFDAILLTSANGARALIDHWRQPMMPPPLFAVGKKTATLLEKQGWPVIIPPRAAGGERLAATIRQQHPRFNRFLFPRAEIGRAELIEHLRRAGKSVTVVSAYRAETIKRLPAAILDRLAAGRIDAIPFFSGRSASAFLAALPESGREWLKKPLLVAISPVTGQTLREHGLKADLTATKANAEGILRVLSDHWRTDRP